MCPLILPIHKDPIEEFPLKSFCCQSFQLMYSNRHKICLRRNRKQDVRGRWQGCEKIQRNIHDINDKYLVIMMIIIMVIIF